MRNYKRRLAKDAKLRSGTADDQKPRLSDASLASTRDSDGEQPPEEPAEAADEESPLSKEPFLNNDELVDLMHGGPWPAAASPRRSITEMSLEECMTPLPSPSSRSSEATGNLGDALPVHQFEGEAETQSGTMPFEEEQGDRHGQEDSPSPWPCDSNGNDALKDASRACSSETEMNDDDQPNIEENLPGALRAEETSSAVEMLLPPEPVPKKLFLNNDELLDLMHGDPWPPAASPGRPSPSSRSSEATGNLGDALPVHQFEGEAETQSGTMPFEEEQGDRHGQEDESGAPSPSQSTCDSDGNESPKDTSRELPDPEQPTIKAWCDDNTCVAPADACIACGRKAPADLFHPACDLLRLGLASSQRAGKPSARPSFCWQAPRPALLEHLSAARLQCQIPAKSDAIVAFSAGVDRILSDSEPFPDDVECQKRFDCQDWCLALAKTDTTHFSEDYVRQTVGKNLTDLLTHCRDSDQGVRGAAHHIVKEHAYDGLGFVKELLANTVLSQMTDILSTGRGTQPTWNVMKRYMEHLEPLLRWLTKRQRQVWASLLVKVLYSLQPASAPNRAACQKVVVDHLKLLCFADDDPNRTYADEKRQLLALSDSADFEEVKNGMPSLFCGTMARTPTFQTMCLVCEEKAKAVDTVETQENAATAIQVVVLLAKALAWRHTGLRMDEFPAFFKLVFEVTMSSASVTSNLVAKVTEGSFAATQGAQKGGRLLSYEMLDVPRHKIQTGQTVHADRHLHCHVLRYGLRLEIPQAEAKAIDKVETQENAAAAIQALARGRAARKGTGFEVSYRPIDMSSVKSYMLCLYVPHMVEFGATLGVAVSNISFVDKAAVTMSVHPIITSTWGPRACLDISRMVEVRDWRYDQD
ncbi:unnamed protein product [Symbiodinium sp. CCMP2592]|nr:unnamed protein product [Symbiodinium sp. CCMP2592]